MGRRWIGFLIVLLPLLDSTAAATKFTVGDGIGWAVPSNASFYDEWASDKTFQVGDSIVFNWSEVHNVLEVTSKSEYDNCTTTNGILRQTSPVTIDLTANSTLYFICTVGQHCALGQKVTIKVGNGISSPSPSSPSNSANPSCSATALFTVLTAAVIYFLRSLA
ncbi:cucumber peeling cupredoxin [Ricinus communis]|uniref:Cucumber peeling cupredoxin, putative n=1 Tax=Ricinus communis TaxID=3988 RepID=B9SMH2_RICCO|nr:cucumber peeling cupredoxin [Ricinus communis]EEF35204.1 Cucumber peeling cupredoxin, putative [Ricinus communis]|eukprot:XP_002527191.1 cucumber peeling cupredoxin [Ricinus communis]